MAKKKKKKPKTTAPSGLSVTRKGNKVTFSWTIGDSDYGDGQQFYWYINGELQEQIEYTLYRKKKNPGSTPPIKRPGHWTPSDSPPAEGYQFAGYLWEPPNANIGNTTTSKTKTVDFTRTDLSSISFKVRGQKKKYEDNKYKYNPTWSDWVSSKKTVNKPKTPTAGVETDTSKTNVSTFSWAVADAGDDSFYAFTKIQYQLGLSIDGGPVTWGSIVESTSAAGSTGEIKEALDFHEDPDRSYKRVFRVKAIGPKGETDWTEKYHIYAFPKRATNVEATLGETVAASAHGYRLKGTWNVGSTPTHPVEDSIMEYVIAEPVITRTIQNNKVTSMIQVPGSLNWTTVPTAVANTPNQFEDAYIYLDHELEPDEAVFFRVITRHDGGSYYRTVSNEILVEHSLEYAGLPNPTGCAVVSIGNGQVTVRAVNSSSHSVSSGGAAVISVYCREGDNQSTSKIIGMIEDTPQITCQIPDYDANKEYSFGFRTIVADYSPAIPYDTGATVYTISKEYIGSKNIIWVTGRVPIPPKNVTAIGVPAEGKISVTWDWTWALANIAELSWADHIDAWESTDQPSFYSIEEGYPTAWNIAGISPGTWYVKVRLNKDDGEGVKNGTWSDTQIVKVSSAPVTPSLYIIPSNATINDDVTCYWSYSTTDGTSQAHAEICEATKKQDNSWRYGSTILRTNTEQHITFKPKDLGWTRQGQHFLAVRVGSQSGERSDNWSIPTSINIVSPITPVLTLPTSNTGPFKNVAVVIDTEEGTTENRFSLIKMPFSVTIGGAGTTSSCNVIIERADDYYLYRPDDNDEMGYRGETVASLSRMGNGTITVKQSDLYGYMDDGAKYNIVLTIRDIYGQEASISRPFEVHWEHQALMPTADIEMDNEHNVAIITPSVPEDTVVGEGDTCDIYRLSADKPELILSNGSFFEKYVDLYPTLGESGGYRIVYKTVNGDYIVDDADGGRRIAWYDTRQEGVEAYLDQFAIIINFEREEIVLPYDITVSHSWKKDFQSTRYLGGTIVGDWNPGVDRTSSIKTTVTVNEENDDNEDSTVYKMRMLADYAGACHIRTPDGSSFTANIDVSEDREAKWVRRKATFDLSITRVAPQAEEVMTYDRWIEQLDEDS